jgi:ribulose 1,5-bisphosphate synthetase/thiazole synthase
VKIDEITISRAIIESFTKEFLGSLEVDVAIAGAGPSGMTAAYYLAKAGVKTVVFEKNLRVGGGMPGGLHVVLVPLLLSVEMMVRLFKISFQGLAISGKN